MPLIEKSQVTTWQCKITQILAISAIDASTHKTRFPASYNHDMYLAFSVSPFLQFNSAITRMYTDTTQKHHMSNSR
jgi:hypothetical protein